MSKHLSPYSRCRSFSVNSSKKNKFFHTFCYADFMEGKLSDRFSYLVEQKNIQTIISWFHDTPSYSDFGR